MLIREAIPADNAQLLQLTRQSPMAGYISVCIDRQPDFFALLKKRGDSTVLVAENQGLIIGVFSASKHFVWLNGEVHPIYYLADFKVHPSFRGSSAGVRMGRHMTQLLKDKHAGLFFCTMAAGNHRVMPFFKGRAGLPSFKEIGGFSVLQILPSPFRPRLTFPLTDTAGNPDNIDLKTFYNDQFQKYQLGPVVHHHDLKDCRHLMLVENGQVKAAISLMDTSRLKQNIVIKMPWHLEWASIVSNLIAKIIPIVPLPGKGAPIRMWNIRYFGCAEGDEKKLLTLVKAARHLAWKEKLFFLSIGFQKSDPFLKLFKKFPNITFHSVGLLTTLNGGELQQMEQIAAGLIFEDFSLV